MSEPLVIVGQGMAATKLVEELAERALGRYAIAVVGEEPRRAYNRVLLSSLLAKEVAAADIELKPAAWWARKGVSNIFGQKAVAIDRAARQLRLESGATLPYGKLVIATGSDPLRPPVEGMDLPGVLTFRSMEDVDLILSRARPGRPAVVIGGGLLGLEAAYGLAKAGADVTLLHLAPRLMERQLDAPAARLLKDAIEAKGCEVLLEANTARVLGDGRVEAVELADGRVLPADLLVCAIGVRPNVALAQTAGLACGRGILVDDHMRTSDPDIFAIGECAEHRGIAYGLVEPAYEQARTVARSLTGDPQARYEGSVLATNLKVSGVSLFSAGDFLGEERECLLYEDESRQIYKKLVLDGDRLAGTVLYGDTADGLWYLDLMRSGANVSSMRDALIFGRQAVMN